MNGVGINSHGCVDGTEDGTGIPIRNVHQDRPMQLPVQREDRLASPGKMC